MLLWKTRKRVNDNNNRYKYVDLARGLKKLWNMKVMMLLIVFGALGAVTNGSVQELEDLEIKGQVDTI